ncbi:MAG: metallophosphoesterase [Ktedonobacteraceae bacterium]|nr:metallophosphoesterase [Ktedonobacteraceae bacterium]
MMRTIVNDQELLYFWALGDLHYRTLKAWNEIHTQRLAPMFEDLQALWQEEGKPAFCVSPGDMVETCAPENYRLARIRLESQLGIIPFYAGIGNHEYYGPEGEDPETMADTFTTMWEKPLRYAWVAGNVACIMLDYPDPHTLAEANKVYISQETLNFLNDALKEFAAYPAVVFLHCPLHNTVLDRDPEQHRDYNSLQSFFAPENSQEVRNILARHKNVCLYLSGHTHSGWEAPNLVTTEYLSDHSVTFVNLMSPWYTGRYKGPHVDADGSVQYIPDEPDVLPTFAIRIYRQRISIRVRNHHTRQWLKEWGVPRL